MKINIGDIFIIPLKENRYGYGQVVEFGAFYQTMIAFDFITHEKVSNIQEILSKDIVFFIRTNTAFIEKGYWNVLGSAELPANLNMPKYYIRNGLDDFEVVTASEEFVRIATEVDMNAYSNNSTFTPGWLEDALNDMVDEQDWEEEYEDIIYKPIEHH